MYWNNSWFNNFNQKNYLLKTMFLENLLRLVCSEKIFKFFFFNRFFFSNTFFLKFIKNVELQKQKQEQVKVRHQSQKVKKTSNKKNFRFKFNFSKLWFIKFNGYILVTLFCFFFKWKRIFKSRQRAKKKRIFLNKPLRLHFSFLKWRNRKFKLPVKRFFFF